MNLQQFNNLAPSEAADLLRQCCGSAHWVQQLMAHFPFANEARLLQHATDIWYGQCAEHDYTEAFGHHPKIGDLNSLKQKFAGKEQAAVAAADVSVLEKLATANQLYEQKFGYIFIVCATGKSADEMLRLLEARLHNSPDNEIHIAANEQHKITIIRLKKLLPTADWSFLKVSQLTTHVLDTAIGKPAPHLHIQLQGCLSKRQWRTLAQGCTNHDGRIPDLLPPSMFLAAGDYKMIFDTATYFAQSGTPNFYPRVEIIFHIADHEHYHVPLLLNPFGYSTYRGS